MEEAVRNLLQNQRSPEPNEGEPVDIIKEYQDTLTQEGKRCQSGVEDTCMAADKDAGHKNGSAEEEEEKTRPLLDRLKALEAENSALAMENKNQREQYERCLDEIANQVVQALLTQKDVREECLKLKTRVSDLEQQNQMLSVLFQQRVKPAPGFLLQEGRQNMKSGGPALKCQSQLNLTGPGRVYPRSSCSSSELSLSSAGSEYSSGSSCTWDEGRTCSKRSSVNWDKRISIGSSLPNNLCSPAEDLLPTRIKENHILEGLKKLQKRKIFLTPPSIISKWGYKDGRDSNEGIYSPGIKDSSHKKEVSCAPEEMDTVCMEHQKTFTYDSDLHEDADKDCRQCCNKLTHSVSDSLFGWEPDRRHLPERGSCFNSNERPEKLTSFVNEFQSEAKSCTNVKLPPLEIEKSLADVGWRDLNLHFSDIDDNDILDELYIESSDEKSPSDLSLIPFVIKHAENTDGLEKTGNAQLFCSEKEQVPPPLDIRPKACSFIKQQKIIKKTSSEECVTVIFDAENGKPIEFGSHQTGVVDVTRNELSINHPYTGPDREYTECLPQGKVNLQKKRTDAQKCSILQIPDNETQGEIDQDNPENEPAVVPTTSSNESLGQFERPRFQNIPQQNLVIPLYTISSKASSPSCTQAGINQKQKLTKIPRRIKFSPHISKGTISEDFSGNSSHCPVIREKSPLSHVKCLTFKKTQSPVQDSDSQGDVDIVKLSSHPLENSKVLCRAARPKSQLPEATLPSSFMEAMVCGEPPTRDVNCDFPPAETISRSPPPSPGGSASLLRTLDCEQQSPPIPRKTSLNSPIGTAKNVVKLSPLKGMSKYVFHSITTHDIQTSKLSATAKAELNHCYERGKTITQSKGLSEHSPGMHQGIPKVLSKKISPETSSQSVPCSNQELHHSKDVLSACASQDINPVKNGSLSKDVGTPQKPKIANSFPVSSDCHIVMIGEPSLPQISHSPLSLLSQGSGTRDVPDKGIKPHLPAGFQLLIKSPHLLRKSCTIPGKQEKDSMNAASKICVSSGKCRQVKSVSQATLDAAETDLRGPCAETDAKGSSAMERGMDIVSPVSPETFNLTDRGDSSENKPVKKSVSSSNKTYLKPALGTNGAKARSQSFSIHTGEKPAVPSAEGLGKVRTQMITNTSERGNSLTRQSSSMERFQEKAVSGSAAASGAVSNTTKVPQVACSRQGSFGSRSHCSGSVGSPSKQPFQTAPKGGLFYSISTNKGNKSPSQINAQNRCAEDEEGSEISKHQPVSKKCVTQAETVLESSTSISSEQILPLLKNLDSLPCPLKHEEGQTVLQEACLKGPEASPQVLTSSVSQATIEEKVMLGIQQNVQKEEGQRKSAATETKQKSGGPSIAHWFGFRKSKPPALSGRKAEITKVKVDKKEAKSSEFGSKQAKSEKRKDKKKTELYCEAENELNKKSQATGILDSVPKGKKMAKLTQNSLSQTSCEQKNGSATSGKDRFLKELLHRVDKKAAQQTESGSKNVSCRRESKGSSHDFSLPSNSVSIQGNQKKNIKTKTDVEIPNETLAAAATESFQEDDEHPITDSRCQSHVIESCCQMRTLDSGIGTFPLPDSGNRSTGRHALKKELGLESQEQDFPQAPLEKAKTLEREVPSAANKNQGSVESIISHSTSDPNMTAKSVRPFQSRLPKPFSAGIMSPMKKGRQEESSLTSSPLVHSEKGKSGNNQKIFSDWSSKKAMKTKDRALRVCTYSASSSSSDTEIELEDETNIFRNGGEKLVELMKNSKQAEQEENSVRKSFMGRPLSVLDLYQHSLCGHYGEDGPEQLAQYSFIEQLNGASTKDDGKSKKIPSKLEEPEETKEGSEKRLPKISLESLNKFNHSSIILLEKEKNSLNKVEGQKEENGMNEEVSLNSSDRHDIDHLESLSDSLYDSFSSCTSQGSNDV